LVLKSGQVQRRALHASLAIALCWLATSVHLAAAAYLLLLLLLIIWIAVRQDWPPKSLILAIAVGTIPAVVLVPSALDWYASHSGLPRPKPPHIAKFEALMPPPKNLAGRIHDAAGGQFEIFSNTANAEGVTDQAGERHAEVRRLKVRVVDAVLWFYAFTGFVYAAWIAVRAKLRPHSVTPPTAVADQIRLARLATVTILVPAVLGATCIARVNATYFAAGIPAVLLLLGFGYELLYVARVSVSAFFVCAGVVLAVYTWFPVSLLRDIDRCGFVEGQYYIPLRDQLVTARQLADAGVSARRFTHLSGDWFQRPYEYLLAEVCRAPELTGDPKWAVVEDSNLRRNQQARVRFFTSHARLRHNTVAIALFDSPAKAGEFVNAYYDIPIDDESTSMTLR
jgi:hypothetical protein